MNSGDRGPEICANFSSRKFWFMLKSENQNRDWHRNANLILFRKDIKRKKKTLLFRFTFTSQNKWHINILKIGHNLRIYMEFRKMVTITLCTRQQKRHWCIEQSYGLCWRGRGWEDLRKWHWNMYNIMYEMSCQSRFNAQYWMLGSGALGRPRGMVWGGRREEGSGWGTYVYLWQIHFDIWQN